MKYLYSQTGYHHRDTSFEVEAILRQEDNRKILATFAFNYTITAYNPWSYFRDMEIGFNPLTNQEVTYKYIDKKHKHSLAYEYRKRKKEAHKAEIIKEKQKQHFFKELQLAFLEVIQNMLIKYRLIHKIQDKKVKEHINFLEIEKVNKKFTKTNLNVKYTIHPHVDALLRERAGNNHGIYR